MHNLLCILVLLCVATPILSLVLVVWGVITLQIVFKIFITSVLLLILLCIVGPL